MIKFMSLCNVVFRTRISHSQCPCSTQCSSVPNVKCVASKLARSDVSTLDALSETQSLIWDVTLDVKIRLTDTEHVNRYIYPTKYSSLSVFFQAVMLTEAIVTHRQTEQNNYSSSSHRNINAAFTPDTCRPYTSCIHLYSSVSPVAVYMYPVSVIKLSPRRCIHFHLYPDTSCSSGILVSGYMYLV